MVRDQATLLDILHAARLTLDFKRGLDKEAFLENLKTQSAVLHQLMIIGEAVKRLSPELRAQYPQIPWLLIAGMRDKLIHGYDIVDLDQVWRTVIVDIPELISKIEPLVTKEG